MHCLFISKCAAGTQCAAVKYATEHDVVYLSFFCFKRLVSNYAPCASDVV